MNMPIFNYIAKDPWWYLEGWRFPITLSTFLMVTISTLNVSFFSWILWMFSFAPLAWFPNTITSFSSDNNMPGALKKATHYKSRLHILQYCQHPLFFLTFTVWCFSITDVVPTVAGKSKTAASPNRGWGPTGLPGKWPVCQTITLAQTRQWLIISRMGKNDTRNKAILLWMFDKVKRVFDKLLLAMILDMLGHSFSFSSLAQLRTIVK